MTRYAMLRGKVDGVKLEAGILRSGNSCTKGGGAMISVLCNRYVLQTKRLADAPPGRVGAAAARARIEKASSGFHAASQAARRERTFACRTDARPSRRGQLSAPRLGPVVARAGGVRRIHFAARTLALSRPAPGQPSPTPARPGRALVGRGQVAGQTGTLVQDHNSGSQTGSVAAGNPAGRA